MGYVKARAAVWNPEDLSKGCEVEFLADTGAIYTICLHRFSNPLELGGGAALLL